MKRGFTIVELLVVITVIALLVGISAFSYYGHLNRASDNQALSIADAVSAGAERYYANNNEYPLASVVFGGTPTGAAPANYATASTTLGVPKDVLNNTRVKFVPCAGTACTFSPNDQSDMYYLTKTATDGTAQRQYTIGSCTYTLPSTEDGAMSYLLIYYSKQFGQWKVSKSSRGQPTTSDNAACPFTVF